MNKASHILIGRLLCRRLSGKYGIFLDKGSFLIGSILPDIGFSFLLRPHFLQYSQHHILKKIDDILSHEKQRSAYFGRSISLDLGVLCHYYADFLCYAHSGAYPGDIAGHVRYEKALHRFLASEFSDISEGLRLSCPPEEMTADAVFDHFMARHEEYVRKTPSFMNDITQSIGACTEALLLLAGAALETEPETRELLYTA